MRVSVDSSPAARLQHPVPAEGTRSWLALATRGRKAEGKPLRHPGLWPGFLDVPTQALQGWGERESPGAQLPWLVALDGNLQLEEDLALHPARTLRFLCASLVILYRMG